MNRRKLVIAHWKTNGSRALLSALPCFAEGAGAHVEVAVCPPFPLIASAVDRRIVGLASAQELSRRVSRPSYGRSFGTAAG